MNAIARFITAARTSWIVLVVGIAATAGLFVAAGYQSADAAPPVGLPDSAESVQAAALQEVALPRQHGEDRALIRG